MMLLAQLFALTTIVLLIGALVVVWRLDPTQRGAAWLAGSYAVGVMAMTAYLSFMGIVNPDQPYGPFSAATNCLFCLSAALFARAVPTALGTAPPRILTVTLPSITALVQTVLTLLQYNVAAGWLTSVGVLIVFLGVAWTIRRAASTATERVLVVSTSLGALFLLAAPVAATMAGLDATTVTAIRSQVAPCFFGLITGAGALAMYVERIHSRLVNASRRDPLTGLLNRRGLDAVAVRPGGAVIMTDIDRFKAVNDTHGHAAGDAVLVGFATLLAATVRAGDPVARLGGEEFVVVLPGATPAVARLVAEGLRTALAGTPQPALDERPVTASFGVADWRPSDRLDDAVARADAALYDAKRGGRNRTVIAADPTAAPATHEMRAA